MFKIHNSQALVDSVQADGVAGLLKTPPETEAVEAYRAKWRTKTAEAEAQAADFADRLSKAIGCQHALAVHLEPVAGLLAQAMDAIALGMTAGVAAQSQVPECCPADANQDMLYGLYASLRKVSTGIAAALETVEQDAAALAKCK